MPMGRLMPEALHVMFGKVEITSTFYRELIGKVASDLDIVCTICFCMFNK